ncbi:MAG: hypothetical protein H0X66_05930 [Verrucomicrobia bacterium]|nr:hypothetical protein [Verrucomicrobiota bacterium]
MKLSESIVEDAALTWFRELGYAIGHGPHLAPGEYAGGTLTRPLPAGEEKRGAIRRLNPAIPEEAQATGKRDLQVRSERSTP